ncbi:hypothetical protein CHCC14821_3485 [Bacillus paralicheniformis]|nr:hypothetical protein CHCC14821_3485 [Bacillus paralicheniformis]
MLLAASFVFITLGLTVYHACQRLVCGELPSTYHLEKGKTPFQIVLINQTEKERGTRCAVNFSNCSAICRGKKALV